MRLLLDISTTLANSNPLNSSAESFDHIRAALRELSSFYTSLDNFSLALLLGQNLQRFSDPEKPGFITADFLGLIVKGQAGSKFTDADKALALEILSRDGFVSGIDLDSNNQRDGKFDLSDIHRYMDSL